MEIGSGYSNGLQGYQRASQQISEETANINRQSLATDSEQPAQDVAAQQSQQTQSLASSVVNLSTELNNAQANVRSIDTADEVLGSIIDIRV